MEATITEKAKEGHSERLRKRFLTGNDGSYSDQALLELLLTYAIPQKDVKPLSEKLISKFNNLEGVLSADVQALSDINGIKSNSAILLKVIDWIRTHHSSNRVIETKVVDKDIEQSTLFEVSKMSEKKSHRTKKTTIKNNQKLRTGLFSQAILKESIEILPKLPETDVLEDIKKYLIDNLSFSAFQTRRRYADYIIRRMFPDGHAYKALRSFSAKFSGLQELKDVCFYRFCKAEPLMFDIVNDLLFQSIGIGRLNRSTLRDYLTYRFTQSRSITESTKAIIDALSAGGIIGADRKTITFSYRDILIPSFAFILHCEFPESGMYNIEKLETNRAIRALLWNPTRILPALYEMRNQGLLSKISEIDNIRQFTTRWTLDELVTKLLD